MFGTIIVTGGLGFIGKHFIDTCIEKARREISPTFYDRIINIDKISYASDLFMHEHEFQGKTSRYSFINSKVEDLEYLPDADFIVNFAAESHVDNSFTNNEKFLESNIRSVHHLLELIREKYVYDRPKLIHISTDEVYGSINTEGFDETSNLNPSNPYSATKAAADLLVIGWAKTYGIPYNIIRMTNVYGVNQYPEKLIPKSCNRLLQGKSAILHGDGSYVRSWLHISDAIEAIFTVMKNGKNKEIYNVCGNIELSNKEVVSAIAEILAIPEEHAYIFTENRVSQDQRYSLKDDKIKKLGWRPQADFYEKLREIVREADPGRFLKDVSRRNYWSR